MNAKNRYSSRTFIETLKISCDVENVFIASLLLFPFGAPGNYSSGLMSATLHLLFS